MSAFPLEADTSPFPGDVGFVPIADKKCWRQAWPWAAIPKTVVRWEGNVMMPQVHNHARCQLRRRRLSAYHRWVTSYPPSFRRSKSTASLSLEARLSNDLCPFGAFGPEQGSSLVRRIADRHEAKRRHFLHDVRQRDNLDDLAMEQRGNLLRRSGRNDEREPSLALYFRIAGFRHAGHRRQCLRPHLARHSQCAQLAFLDLRHGRWQRGEGNGRMPGERRGDRQARAVEGHMHKVEAEQQAEVLANEMWRGPCPRRSEAVFGGTRFDQSNEILDGLDCQ